MFPLKRNKRGFTPTLRTRAGFTLVELLVVIAIIGILASIVLVSLNSARVQSRDARRIADLSQVRTALEGYFLDNNTYPVPASWTTDLTSGGFISVVPTDPQSGSNYLYDRCGSGGVDYTLGATLENANNNALDSDVDTAACTGVSCTDPNYCVEP